MTPPEIPSDVIDDIIDQLDSDFDTLKAISASSRIMRHLAQKRLFKTVYLNCYSRCLPNLRLLARASIHNPLLKTYVQYLKITISPRDFHNTELITFISQLTRVRALHLLNNAMLFSDEWQSIPLPFRTALTQVMQSSETLRLENISDMPISNLIHAQNLKTLILMDTTLTAHEEMTSPFDSSKVTSNSTSSIQECVVQFSLARFRPSRNSSTLKVLANMDLSKLSSLKFITNNTANVRALEKITRNAHALKSFKLQVLPSHHNIHLGYLSNELLRALYPILPSLIRLELALCGIEEELASLELLQSLLNPFRDYNALQEFHLRLYLRDEEYDVLSLEDGLADLRNLFRRTDLNWPSFRLASASVMNLDAGILSEDSHKHQVKSQRSDISFLSLLR
ncbi:hypothetical protein CVT24_003398 [Panaeolus cyanescens]|uniref:F-box domain-containing protein n=1 Tax=Panaeolus cyanescens TaxID=181874 RepID=A0A409Y771_9AGAR|nr:hypothetical protein CVT24_003398 [Panaeolus cyanescens]